MGSMHINRSIHSEHLAISMMRIIKFHMGAATIFSVAISVRLIANKCTLCIYIPLEYDTHATFATSKNVVQFSETSKGLLDTIDRSFKY